MLEIDGAEKCKKNGVMEDDGPCGLRGLRMALRASNYLSTEREVESAMQCLWHTAECDNDGTVLAGRGNYL